MKPKQIFFLILSFVTSIIVCGAVGLFVGITVAENNYTEFVYRGSGGWESRGLLGLHLGILSGLAIGIYIWQTRFKNSAKSLKILLIIIVLLGIGIALPTLFLKENPDLTLMASVCTTDEDPRIVASMHFDHPLQRLLTFTTIVTGDEDGAVYVSGYTLFGLELTKARVACASEPLGGIRTIKSFFFVEHFAEDDFFYKRSVSYKIVNNSSNYAEYEFDGSINRDSGSWDMLRQLQQDKKSLHGESKILSGIEDMKWAERDELDVIERYTAGNNVYELRGGDIGTSYSLYKNDTLLFKRNMEYGADGPIVDWRIVDGKPAFTVRISCPVIDSVQTCTSDVFYDRQFMNEKYKVEDSRYLFAYNGKIGFVAKDDDGKDRIFFDGSFMTPAFDEIHTHNCCSIQQILPTVYENGVLLFYGSRDGKDYLAEVRLE